MTSQPYAMIYHDTETKTLQEGIRILHSIPNPILCYRQTLDTTNPYSDIAYVKHIIHDPANDLITLTFPPECCWVSNLRNSWNCKMVMYYKDVESSYIKEIIVTPSMNFDLMSHKDVKIIMYTRGKMNIEIFFDVYLMKIRSRL
jgi:hypothetical protein